MKKGKFLLEATLIAANNTNFATRITELLALFSKQFDCDTVAVYQLNGNQTEATLLEALGQSKWQQAIQTGQLDLLKDKILSAESDVIYGNWDFELAGCQTNDIPIQNFLAPLVINGTLSGFLVFDLAAGKLKLKKQVAIGCFAAILANLIYQNRVVGMSPATFATKVVNSIDRFVIIFDNDGRIVFANDYLCAQTGFALEYLLERNIDEFTTNIASATCDCHFQSLVAIEKTNISLSFASASNFPINLTGQLARCDLKNQECYLGIFTVVESLANELDRFLRLFRNNPVLESISTLPDHRLVSVNEAFVKLTGYEREEIIGNSWQDIGLLKNYEDVKSIIHEINEKMVVENIAVELKGKDGKIHNVLLCGEIVYCFGQMLLLVVMIDITSQKNIQNLYLEQTRRLNSIIEGTRLGTWEWNIKTGATKFNERWAEMLGYKLEELEPISIETWLRLIHPEDVIPAQALLGQHFNHELDFYDAEVRAKAKDGQWVWIHDRGKVIEWDKSGFPVMMYGTHSDITTKKKYEFKISELSNRDPLTNIYNRRYVYERLTQDLKRSSRAGSVFSLAILDIDRFKDINDRYGHLAGDQIIKEFTEIIKGNLREYDLLGRYGGEEFVIILYDVEKSAAAAIVERILEKVRDQSFVYQGSKIHFTFSAGVSDCGEFDKDGISNEKLIGLADKRLYYAKDQGRNRIVF